MTEFQPSILGRQGPVGDGAFPDDTVQALLHAAPEAAVLIDAWGVVRAWNTRATETFGWPAGEALGRAIADLVVPLHLREAVRTQLVAFLARPDVEGVTRTVELPLLRRDGVEIAARVSIGVHGGARGRGAACFLHDLSTARRAEAALRERERQQRQIIDLVPHFIFAKDAAGRFILVNEAVARAYGTRVEELLGKSDADFNPNAEEVAHFRADDLDVLRGGKPKLVPEEIITDATGRQRILETIKIPFALGEEGTPAVLGVSTDITERRRVEADLLHAQKMEGIGRLAGGVAHDFNNLLTAILGSVHLLEEALPAGDPLRRETAPIRTAAERAAALTRQLLTFARRDPVRPQPVDLSAMTLDLDRMLRRVLGAPIELVTRADPTAGAVEIDPGQLEQVLVNLVVNARDAMPGGGRLTITTGPVAADACPAPAVGQVAAGPWVELTVADSGGGIPKEVLPRIFEPFFTTKGTGVGTGLGLSICYGIVKRYGGHIWAESEPGRSTTFRIVLPRTSRTPTPRTRPRDGPPSRGGETVLVVDDEEAVRAIMARGLRDQGYTVLEASSGPEAIARAADHAGPLPLVVADVVMPGMSGPDAVARIRATRPGVRVLFVSGFYDRARLKAVGAEGADVLAKPFTPAELARAVRATLDRTGAPNASAR